MKKRIFIILMLFSFLLSACTGGKSLEYGSDHEAVTESEKEEAAISEEDQVPLAEETTTESSEKQKEESVFIDISGEVAEPGVYELPAGNRVFHAILAAGGFTENAETRCVNQADPLVDGEMIYIYSREEAKEAGGWMYLSGKRPLQGSGQNSGPVGNSSGSQPESGDRVNINQADLSQLMSINGIGEARAEAILSYRERNGGFSAIEDIMNVSGIKEKLFEQIRDKITV